MAKHFFMAQHFFKVLVAGLLLSSLFTVTSCNGILFSNKLDGPSSTSYTVSIGAITTDSARTILPDGWEKLPEIQDFTDFSISATVNGVVQVIYIDGAKTKKAEWADWRALRNATITLYSDIQYALTLTAKYKESSWTSDIKICTSETKNLIFKLVPAESGSLSLRLTVPDNVTKVQAWDTTEQTAPFNHAPLITTIPTDLTVITQHQGLSCGIHYLWIAFTDTSNNLHKIGPEVIYIMPGQTSTFEKEIRIINTGSQTTP